VNTPYTAAILDPTLIGLAPGSSLVPCIIPDVVVCDAVDPGVADLLFFYDPVHPNSVVHEQLAAIFLGQVAPVPLPAPLALLLVSLAGLVVAGRRRRV